MVHKPKISKGDVGDLKRTPAGRYAKAMHKKELASRGNPKILQLINKWEKLLKKAERDRDELKAAGLNHIPTANRVWYLQQVVKDFKSLE